MGWANFLSMFHFQIVHVEGKKNVVADALSRKPQVSAVSISYHNELEEMKGQYAEDEDFARIYDQIINGQCHEHYTLKSDFLMMHGKLCVTKQLRPKILIECHAPSFAGHRGIDATVKAIDTFFYWPTLRRDVDAFVRSCLVCQKVKFDRQKAPGLLQPLPIPDKPWESEGERITESNKGKEDVEKKAVPGSARSISKDALGGRPLRDPEPPGGQQGPNFRVTGALVTRTTMEVVIPAHAITAIIGDGGSRIVRIRQISGAKVDLLDVRSGASEGVVKISGTPEQTQAAQNLLQELILKGRLPHGYSGEFYPS
ncbi:hypothetical protein L7F22_066941 [Adiantum nelumboides]|nr:hypothetical protein [Adiantum nelumboides]